MTRLSKQVKDRIIELYESGLNVNQIKKELEFKYHQPIINVLKRYPNYVPYRNGHVSIRKYSLNENYFSVIDTEEKAYFLGLICADGHVDTTWRRLRFLLQTLDKDILESFKASINSNAPIKDVVRESPFTYGRRQFQHSTLEVCSDKLVADLEKMGLVSNKTPILDGSILKYVPSTLIRHFLRGYFDGDGSIIIGKDCKRISVEVAANLDFINNTFNKYFPTNTKILKAKRSKHSYYYRVTKRSEILRFLHYLYKDSSVHLKRKFDKYTFLCGHLKPFELLETVQAISSEACSPQERSETIEK